MPMQPGSPQAKMPPAEDALIRRIQEIERVQREMLPSVAASFGPVVADLQAKDVQILDLIASVLIYASNKAFTVGSATTTTRTNMATVALPVPAGFTKAQVWAFSDAMALNSTASPDYLYAGTTINAYEGGENFQPCQSGYQVTVSHTAVTALTGLVGGGVINCIVATRTNTAAWAANGGNLWRVQAVAMFSR